MSQHKIPDILEITSKEEIQIPDQDQEQLDAYTPPRSHRTVPRSERRGLLAQFSLIKEYKDPRDYPNVVKYHMVVFISLASSLSAMVTTISYPAMEDLTRDLKTNRQAVNVSVGLFIFSSGLFPIWWSQFSERFGRRSIYVLSFTFFFAFTVGCAFSKNIVTFIILRTLSGASCAFAQSVGAGTITDIYEPKYRGRALGYYYLGPLLAPLVSPIIGSALLIRWNWRASQWFLVICSGLLELCVLFTLPETLRLQDKQHTAEQHVKEESKLNSLTLHNLKHQSYIFFIKPLKSLRILRYPPVLLATQQGASVFSIVYLMTLGIQYELSRSPYNWPTLYIGFAYAPQSLVFLICSIVGGRWTDKLLHKYKEKHGYYAPECRMSYNVLLGAIALPISALIVGWCFHFHAFWVAPLLGTAIFGIAVPMINAPIMTFLVDSLPGKGATGIAVLNFVRCTVGAVSIFLFDPMIRHLKPGPTLTLFGLLTLVSSTLIIYLKKMSPKFREIYNLEEIYSSLE